MNLSVNSTLAIEGQEKRELIDLAMQAGRRYMSPQTGLIHFCYDDESLSDTIPFFENFCYCLALLRSLVGDHVQEAKERLIHLLSFKLEGGYFPTYLHEYPKKGWGTRSSLPLMLIKKHFGKVLGDELRTLLNGIAPPPPLPKTITSSKEGALMALHLQLEDKGLDSLASYWDPNLQVYSGPLKDEKQRGGEIDLTLFDLFMGNATRTLSPRLLKPHPLHLHASLVFPTEEIVDFPKIDHPKGCHHFRKVWKEGDHLHTLVCQDKKIGYDEGIFTYPKELADDKHQTELNLYVNDHPSIDLLVNGEKGTVFRLGDRVQIIDSLALTLELHDGDGVFLGRISKGNRPAQVLKGFTAYDWKISLRTLRRSPNLKLKLLLLEG